MANKKAVIRLVGGLGNQMFQYAAAVGIAKSQNRRLYLDQSSFETYETWPYQLDCFLVPQDFYDGPPLGGPSSRSLKDRLIRKLNGGFQLREGVYHEPHFHFDPSVFNLTTDDILLDGYFQSPLYFRGADSLIHERFQLKAPLTPAAQKILQQIDQATVSVSLHVRRGDFLTQAASGVHGSLTLDYYHRSIALIKELVGAEATFFLFSDDPDYMEEAFHDLPNACIVRSDPEAPWEDMHLMAHCQHNIIANSSYSWWGAWLNVNRHKRVIAPVKWFAPDKLASINVVDIYPDDWILLK